MSPVKGLAVQRGDRLEAARSHREAREGEEDEDDKRKRQRRAVQDDNESCRTYERMKTEREKFDEDEDLVRK